MIFKSKKNILKALSDGLFLVSILFMLSSLSFLADWLKNKAQVTGGDLILPAILNLILAVFLAIIFCKSIRKNRFSGVIGAFVADILLGIRYNDRLNNFLPFLKAFSPLADLKKNGEVFFSFVFILVILALSFGVIYGINKLVAGKKWKTDVLANAIIITISVAFVLEFFSVGKVILTEWPQFFYKPTELKSNAKNTANKPDIYYIVLDRYTNDTVLKNQMDYDNTAFTQFLTKNNFYVNKDAHSNYPYTTMSIASTLNANYNGDLVKKFSQSKEQTVEPYHDAIRYSSVVKELKKLDYSFYQLGSWYEASNQAPLADKNYQPEGQLVILNHTFTLNTFSKKFLNNSVFAQFVSCGLKIKGYSIISFSSISEVSATLYKLDQLKNIAGQSSGGRFIFAHILVPHDPYYFNADGSLSTDTGDDNIGEPIKQKYLGQVKFINNQMEELINQIDKNSNGKAAVVLQADEGPYPMQLNGEQFDSDIVGDELENGDMNKWSGQDLQMKYGILAAYHVPGADEKDLAAGGDSVNIFRLILNTYFGDNLSYLPRCYYAFPDGRDEPFVYTDITERLTGQKNSACPAKSNF